MTDQLKQAAQAVIKAWDNDGSTQTMEDLRTALAQEHAMHDLARLGQEIEQKPLGSIALAQPEQEPVAYYHPRNGFYWAKPTSIFAPTVVDVPPIPLYTTAAKREWVGLTPEEILDMFDVNNVYGSKWIEFARTVEAALRSKNT